MKKNSGKQVFIIAATMLSLLFNAGISVVNAQEYKEADDVPFARVNTMLLTIFHPRMRHYRPDMDCFIKPLTVNDTIQKRHQQIEQRRLEHRGTIQVLQRDLENWQQNIKDLKTELTAQLAAETQRFQQARISQPKATDVLKPGQGTMIKAEDKTRELKIRQQFKKLVSPFELSQGLEGIRKKHQEKIDGLTGKITANKRRIAQIERFILSPLFTTEEQTMDTFSTIEAETKTVIDKLIQEKNIVFMVDVSRFTPGIRTGGKKKKDKQTAFNQQFEQLLDKTGLQPDDHVELVELLASDFLSSPVDKEEDTLEASPHQTTGMNLIAGQISQWFYQASGTEGIVARNLDSPMFLKGSIDITLLVLKRIFDLYEITADKQSAVFTFLYNNNLVD